MLYTIYCISYWNNPKIGQVNTSYFGLLRLESKTILKYFTSLLTCVYAKANTMLSLAFICKYSEYMNSASVFN